MKIHNLNIYCNMKHLIFTIVALFALTGYSSAQVTSMTLGYCNGEMKTSGTSAFTTPEKDTWLSAAIYIPQSQLSVFHGNCINEIHAGLASSLNIDSMRVWIRTSLDGGHVLFLLYEMITRRKPSEKFLIWAEYIGFGILILLMLVANLNDVLRWLGYM